MFETIPVKLIVIMTIISILVGAFQIYGDDREEQGYTKAIAEYGSKIAELEAQQAARLKEKAAEVIAEQDKRKALEKRIQELLRVEPEVRIHEVIIETECDDFSAINSMWRRYGESSRNISSLGSE